MVVLLTRMQIRCHFSPGETRTGADKQKRRRIKCRAGSQKIRQISVCTRNFTENYKSCQDLQKDYCTSAHIV
jgi:hypothetical protein